MRNKTKAILLIIVFLISSIILGGCNDKTYDEHQPATDQPAIEKETAPTEAEPPTEVPEETLITSTFGSDGGLIELSDGAALLVPAGVSGDEITISLENLGSNLDNTPVIPEGAVVASDLYDARVETGTLDGTVKITLPYDPDILPSGLSQEELEAGLFMAVPKSGYWLRYNGVVDTKNHTFSTMVDILEDPLMMWDFGGESESECDNQYHACFGSFSYPHEEPDLVVYPEGDVHIIKGTYPPPYLWTLEADTLGQCAMSAENGNVSQVLLTIRMYPNFSFKSERFITLANDVPLLLYGEDEYGRQFWSNEIEADHVIDWEEEMVYPVYDVEHVYKVFGTLRKEDGTCLENTLIGIHYLGRGQFLVPLLTEDEARALEIPPPPEVDPCVGVNSYYEGFNSEVLGTYFSNVLTDGWGSAVYEAEAKHFQWYFDQYDYIYTVNSCSINWMSSMPPYSAIVDTNRNFYNAETTIDSKSDYQSHMVWHEGKWKVARNNSQDDLTPLDIPMTNNTDFVVQVNWINYEGDESNWFELQPGETRTIGTAATHIWVFYNQETGERLLKVWLIPTSEPILIR